MAIGANLLGYLSPIFLVGMIQRDVRPSTPRRMAMCPHTRSAGFLPSPMAVEASLKDGVWLESKDKLAVQVSADQAEQAIWCPDSAVFSS